VAVIAEVEAVELAVEMGEVEEDQLVVFAVAVALAALAHDLSWDNPLSLEVAAVEPVHGLFDEVALVEVETACCVVEDDAPPPRGDNFR